MSGGTLRSIMNFVSTAPLSQLKEVSDINYITTGTKFRDNKRELAFWKYNKEFKLHRGLSPFGMMNKMVVYKSASILKYGPQFTVNEYWGSPIWQSLVVLFAVVFIFAFSRVSFLKKFLDSLLPKPGQGPNKEKLNKSNFRAYLQATTTKGKTFRGYIQSERDPGYYETSKMVSEFAICLVLHSESKLASGLEGGFYTPASLFGNTIIDRLVKAKLIFKVDE